MRRNRPRGRRGLLVMLSGYHPVVQSLMGTALTWGLTALGASLVLVFHGGQVQEYNSVVSIAS